MNQTTLNITFEYKDTSESEIKIPVKDFKGAGINKTEDFKIMSLHDYSVLIVGWQANELLSVFALRTEEHPHSANSI